MQEGFPQLPQFLPFWQLSQSVQLLGGISPKVSSGNVVAGPERAGEPAGTGAGDIVPLLFMPISPPIAIWHKLISCSLAPGEVTLNPFWCHHIICSCFCGISSSGLHSSSCLELQLPSFLHFVVVQLFNSSKFFLVPHQILSH